MSAGSKGNPFFTIFLATQSDVWITAGVSDAHLFFLPDSFMELIICFVAMAVNGELVGVLCVASSSSTDHI